jgi:hypothetical protein
MSQACLQMSWTPLVAVACTFLLGAHNAQTCRLVPKSSQRRECTCQHGMRLMSRSRKRQEVPGMSADVMDTSGGCGLHLPARRAQCADMPAGAEKQPASGMHLQTLRATCVEAVQAPGYARHVCRCHVHLWWLWPAPACSASTMRRHAGWCRKADSVGNAHANTACDSCRGRASARICQACLQMSWTPLVAVACTCVLGAHNAPTCRLVPGTRVAHVRLAERPAWASHRRRAGVALART